MLKEIIQSRELQNKEVYAHNYYQVITGKWNIAGLLLKLLPELEEFTVNDIPFMTYYGKDTKDVTGEKIIGAICDTIVVRTNSGPNRYLLATIQVNKEGGTKRTFYIKQEFTSKDGKDIIRDDPYIDYHGSSYGQDVVKFLTAFAAEFE